ncbi:MAG: phospholipid carrier-dependent glycosyltransferase, partial [Eubacteriales bacterium]|nr:phospholipid carrier-dependent glycosyltransferase [Eubacteriales bacterium]
KGKRIPAALKTLAAVIGAVAVIFLLALPFQGEQPPDWLIKMYTSTTTSYAFASIEAFNMAALFGGNWASVTNVCFGLPYQTWGTIGIAVSVLAAAVLYVKGRKQNAGALFFTMGFLFVSLFTLGHYMHERYIAPAILLLLCAYAYYKDKRLLIASLWFSVTLLFNAGCAIYIVDHAELRGALYNAFTGVGSFLTVAGFIYLCYTAWDMVLRGNCKPVTFIRREAADTESLADGRADTAPLQAKADVLAFPAPADTKLHFTRRDRWYCLTLTAVYAVIALLNLGSMQAPETAWQTEQAGETVTVSFPGEYHVAQYRVFDNIGIGDVLLSANGADESAFSQTYDDMFRWAVRDVDFTASEVTVTVYSGRPNLNEMAFFTAAGERIPVAAVSENGAALFDEQDTVPDTPSYYNGMYFDELYHARTAYEHLHGIDPYENSHPPLGKVCIMLGIAVFGMNPFGWRIVGTLFGIFMVPVLYCFGKRLFKKEAYALLTALLFAFDFMHFTQTRIATIDVYAVFFIILMYYYMYQYTVMNFYVDGLKKTLKPLALSGLFFALGAASKWIGIYAGLGLAVLLAITLVRRYLEYRRAEGAKREQTAVFARYTVQTLLWCCIFFIGVPVIVYLLSYMPYYLCENRYGLESVWNYQKYMWSYHSGLVATHPYQSSWWQWPFTLRPMWYFSGGYEAANTYSSISASGNPAVWWVCSIGSVIAVIACAIKKMKLTPGVQMAMVGIAANFLPWVLVPRCTFIYHFFATVPFILLLTVSLLRQAEQRFYRLSWVKWAWMGLAVLLFVLLYPGLSGLPIPDWYAGILKLLPGGGLLYGA